jgi:hypothetical protein
LLLAFGSLLLIRHSRGSPLLPSEGSEHLLNLAWADYRRDAVAQADSAKGDAFIAGPDPLLAGLKRLKAAAVLTPMDGRTHGLTGMLALHFDDQDDLAAESFARHLVLDPSWIRLPLVQADAWSRISPERVSALWSEAIRRARAADSAAAGSGCEREVLGHINKAASANPALAGAARAACCGPPATGGPRRPLEADP